MIELSQDYRFEVKIPIPINRLTEVQIWLLQHSLMFKCHYAPRYVNSLYLDTPLLTRYEENLSGISQRKKVRVRWYGDISNADNAKLEFKHRQAGKGFKISYHAALDLKRCYPIWDTVLTSMYRQLSFEAQLLWQSEHTPILICRYHRAYYVSACHQIRATFDSNMSVFEQRYRQTANLTDSVSLGEYVLLELKAPANQESALSRLVSTCPLRPSRHSKYVNGIRRLTWL